MSLLSYSSYEFLVPHGTEDVRYCSYWNPRQSAQVERELPHGFMRLVIGITTRAGVDCDSPVLFRAVHADARPNELGSYSDGLLNPGVLRATLLAGLEGEGALAATRPPAQRTAVRTDRTAHRRREAGR